jgi:hypothetical protein
MRRQGRLPVFPSLKGLQIDHRKAEDISVEELCVSEDPIFKSFLQVGFECSTHKTKAGKRPDLVASTQHDRLVIQDYQRTREMGMATAREGARWHRIEAKPGVHDFPRSRLSGSIRNLGIEIIWTAAFRLAIIWTFPTGVGHRLRAVCARFYQVSR